MLAYIPYMDPMGYYLPSGKQTYTYWTWPFIVIIVSFSIQNGDFP